MSMYSCGAQQKDTDCLSVVPPVVKEDLGWVCSLWICGAVVYAMGRCFVKLRDAPK